MASTEGTSTQINKLVEPLVDSLSSLVLEAIGGSMKEVSAHCAKMVEATTNLINIAQQVAINSGDEELTTEIIHSINFIADQIDGFVTSFVALSRNTQNPDFISAFSKAAEAVGDAVNNLVSVADETSQKRMVALTRKAIQKGKALEKVQTGVPRGELFSLAQAVHETHQQLIEVCQRAALQSSLPRKRELLNSGADSLRALTPKLIDVAKELNDDPTDSKLQQAYTIVHGDISAAYKNIVEAVKIEESNEFAKLKATLAKIAQLIEATKKLQRDADNLISKIMSGAPMGERVALAEEVEKEVNDVLDFARALLQDINDPVVRRVVEKAMADVREYGKQLIDAAKKDGPDAKRNAMIAHQNLVSAAQRLVLSSRNNAMTTYPIHLASEALNAAVYDLHRAIESGDPDAITKSATEAAKLAHSLANDLQKKADECDDPEEKRRYLQAADAVRNAAVQLIQAAKELAANPTSSEARQKMIEAEKALDRAIQMARTLEATPAGFENVDIAYRIAQQEEEERRRLEAERKAKEAKEASVVPAPKPFSIFDFEINPNDDALVKAAKEQALAALEVIREAEQYLADNSDPEYQRKVREASNAVKEWSQKVVELARLAAENPNDPRYQRELAIAQIELAKAIQNLTLLTNKDNAKLTAAVKELQDAAGDTSSGGASDVGSEEMEEFFKLAQIIIQKIDENFGENAKVDVQAGVVVSKEISAIVTKAGGALNKMAQTVKTKEFSDKLNNSSKVICDNALKMKILAAVKAASGDDHTGQLRSSALGLKTQVQGVVNDVKALSLRHRVKQTEKQVLALKRIAEAVRKARFF